MLGVLGLGDGLLGVTVRRRPTPYLSISVWSKSSDACAKPRIAFTCTRERPPARPAAPQRAPPRLLRAPGAWAGTEGRGGPRVRTGRFSAALGGLRPCAAATHALGRADDFGESRVPVLVEHLRQARAATVRSIAISRCR
jgi:hypothetical protein